MGIFNADVIINIPPAFFSLQKSGLVRVYLTSVFLLLSVPRCFGDQKPQFDFNPSLNTLPMKTQSLQFVDSKTPLTPQSPDLLIFQPAFDPTTHSKFVFSHHQT